MTGERRRECMLVFRDHRGAFTHHSDVIWVAWSMRRTITLEVPVGRRLPKGKRRPTVPVTFEYRNTIRTPASEFGDRRVRCANTDRNKGAVQVVVTEEPAVCGSSPWTDV
jgi:hypothetical protein